MNNIKFETENWKGVSGIEYCWARLPEQTIFTPKENPIPGIEGLGDTEAALALGEGETAQQARENAIQLLKQKLAGKKTRSIHTLAKEGITQW